MSKHRETWFLAGGVAMLTLSGVGVANAARQPDVIDVAETAEGRLSIDQASVHDHHGHGWLRALSTIELVDPIADAGRMLTSVDQIQDWDCTGRRYRVVRRIFRTDDGQYVRSESGRGAWSPVGEGGAERKAFEFICPSETRSKGAVGAEMTSAEIEGKRRRSGAAVIWMPGARPDAPKNSSRRR